MTLAAGTRFGAYEITVKIGAGGMGEVYRATDTHLKRNVAIKVLPASFANDADRLARFRREAEVLASLNHPNIAQIHGLEDANGTTALILELVDGPTLAERISQGPIPSDEALGIAMQIADALEAAHSRGIVHRDLKPANIKLKSDGTVKVLDFGIAKPLDAALNGPSPTAPSALTETGIVLGSAAYMSPEQARGKSVDQRTDIWAFGCVLHEMLTGRTAFLDEDIATTLARVGARDADPRGMPSTIPAAVQRTITLCLEQEVKKRVADIRDVKLALAGAFQAHVPSGAGAVSARPIPLRTRLMWPALAAALAVVALAAFLASPSPSLPQPETRLAAVPPPEVGAPDLDTLALSPDGRHLVLPGPGNDEGAARVTRLWLWPLDSREARPLPGTELARRAFWSPDSRFVWFTTTRGALKKVDILGGSAQTMAEGVALAGVGGGSNRGDVVLFGNAAGGLSRVRSTGGELTVVTVVPNERGHHELPLLLPDGEHFLYYRHAFAPELDGIYVGSIEAEPADQPSEALLLADDGPLYLQDGESNEGYLLFVRESTLLAQRFDARTLRLSGTPLPIATDLPGSGGDGRVSASVDGRVLVFREGLSGASIFNQQKTLVWVHRDGTEEPISAQPDNYHYADLSPDGRQIALDIRAPGNDIWTWDVERRTRSRLTFDEEPNLGLAWSPDSARVAFFTGSGRTIDWQLANGVGEPVPIGPEGQPSHIASDGTIIFETVGQSQRDIFRVAVGGNPAPVPLVSTPASERNASVSPNGQYLAYQSNESGQTEVYVRPFPDVSGGRWLISSDGGTRPLWSDDGLELYYFAETGSVDIGSTSGAVMVVPVQYGPFQYGNARQLFAGDYMAPNAGLHTYDVARDGRFLMIKAIGGTDGAGSAQLVVAQNWLAGVKQRIADAAGAD